MAKIRISALAKEIDVQSKDVVTFLAAEGITVKAQNSIDDDVADKVRNSLKKGANAKALEKTAIPDAEVKKDKVATPPEDHRENHDNSDADAAKKKKSSSPRFGSCAGCTGSIR